MALTRIDNPTPSAPAALADYVQILAVANAAQLQALRGNSHSCIDFTNNFARAGVVFYVAGVLYKAVTDQAISGTPSKYVKITPSGATAAIAYVASLAGVSWNDAQSGYYDGSGNLYVFDEARAVYDGVVSAGKTLAGQIAYVGGALGVKSGIIENGRTFLRKIVNIGDWNMDADITKTLALGISSGAVIRGCNVFIVHDNGVNWYPIQYNNNPDNTPCGSFRFDNFGNIVINRSAGNFFDSTSFDSTSYNRGWVTIEYEP